MVHFSYFSVGLTPGCPVVLLRDSERLQHRLGPLGAARPAARSAHGAPMGADHGARTWVL